MAEQQPRKKLSLGRKTLSTNRTTTISNNLKTKLQEKKESNISSFFKKANKEISGLYAERQKVCEQITQIEQRLLFAKSEPLQEFLFELKTKDFELLSQINALIQAA
ncbi:hypothetical protein [Francisella adeliensis]|uniref:Uncharacterized protein n=1 Tax=Francisella adeliensis TaxID=2007306 RepID=A0A2Z4XWV6_9GAMM|nr:hypothetical protein [Francisella adeliensis]AXA33098.1 hypothetical protein CDH04_01105 [Francisella adeliensis]MBK2086010.1 hypothetical protein [Francisella adeliensis]MBK2096826.1 hypothetical protein [Francisella adeliensis]QIW11328.1 hypothetical protein FZC43_01105 [Francisella adeliensis]QIW13202.1 hypothetical protein FZC44_01105 [Francisella adeliensis]